MKKLSKILALVLVLVMMITTLPIITLPASAANIPGGTKLYLVPSANWNQSNARFAAYFFGDGEAWVSMTKVAGQSNLYEVTSPAGKNFTNVIFCRMNPSASANNWNNKWNQTSDLTYNGTSNCYTVKEGTWDKGGGTWSTYGSACSHANVGAAATCTTAQVCLDCGDPVVDALGHTYNSAHLCTRCNCQATFTVAGSGAHLGTEWDTGNTANDMTYADGTYTKVYTNVAAGSYLLKVVRDHDWGTAYPSADKAYTVATSGSTVTVTLKGTTVDIKVEVPHVCSFSEATCTTLATCSCGETQGELAPHNYVDGKCSACEAVDPSYTVVNSLEDLKAALLNSGNILLNADIESPDVLSVVTNTVINGNGHKLVYTGSNRAIDVSKDYADVNLTIVNLTINTTASFVERGINYNTNGTLTLNNVTVDGVNVNYAINLPGSSSNATVIISDSNIKGNIALNIWGRNVVITATNTNFVSPYVSDKEVCAVIKFNNDGTTAAHGSSLTVEGGSIVSADTDKGVSLSVSTTDTSVNISDETVVEGKMTTTSILILYKGQNEFYSSASLQSAINTAAKDPERATVVLIGDVALDAPIVVEGTVVLDLNGYTLSYNSTVMGEAMITNKGNLTINDSVGTGVINYNYTGANDASYGKGNYTISNAGTLTVNGGKITIANLSGHAKYPIDNNSTTGDAILVINGGHLYNYNTSAIRMFCNSTTYKNSVTINGGLIEGYCAIWMQQPSATATVKGDLTINGGEIRTTAKDWVNGTSALADVASYVKTTSEGGAWSEDSFINITGGTFNENLHVYYNAPANVTVSDEAVFNGGCWYYVPHTHEWSEPTCTEPAKCECGETQGEALGHTFADATCTAPKTCSVCDTTEGEALGHTWADATCTAPKTCACGATEGEALGHTAGAEATCTTAQTCTVCGTELVAKLGHLDENLDTYCDREGCTGRPVPPTESKVSNFTANHLATISTSNMYYVEGVIVEVLDQKNGIFLIDDGTGETFYFRLPKNADGVSHASWEVKLTLGDKVQVYGKINKYTTTTAPNGQYWPAIQGGVVTLLEQHAHVANGEPVCTKDTLCACGAVVATATGHIDADGNSMCDNCPWDMNLVEVNIAIGTDAKYNGVVTNGDDGKALYWTWTAENFDAIIHKGTSTVTVYTTAKDYMQLKTKNTLTIVNKEDVTVKYVVISVTNATYLGHLKTALTNSGYEYTADETNFTATIQLNSAEDFVLENKASSTIYVNGVTIVYAKKGAHIHEFKETITTPATCTEAGLKTFTCDCGEGTYTEVIEALGHDFVEGVCSRCGVEDPEYIPPCAHKDTGLDAKCDVCGEYFLPTSPFKLEMYQATKGETYYFTGSMSGYYFAASTDITKAVDLYAEEVEGGYNVYFMSGSTKNYLYIELSGTHINAKFGTTKAVWYVDAQYGSLTTEVDGTKYFLGTYGTYVTFGGTAYSRLTASTADVSQYVGRAVSLADHECTNTTSTVTAPTCTAQGYTTYKCADCGLSTKGDYVDALGHTAGAEATCTTAQTCTVCGTELVAALGHNHSAVVTAPTCTEAGYTTYTCACGDTYTDDEVAALGHTEEVVAGKDATCTEAGLTEGKKCSVCGETLVAQEEIPATGHTFVEGKCECGAEDPDYVPEQPPVDEPTDDPADEPTDEPQTQPELTGFAKIWAAILAFFAKFAEMFKGLFAKG